MARRLCAARLFPGAFLAIFSIVFMHPLPIDDPQFQRLRSLPSSMGWLEQHLVLYDGASFLAGDKEAIQIWFAQHERELAETAYDTSQHPLYLVHSTTSRGEAIVPLQPSAEAGEQCTCTRTNLDSVLIYHCLAVQQTEETLFLKSGIHEWLASEDKPNLIPQSWQDIADMQLPKPFDCLKLAKSLFWTRYTVALAQWRDTLPL